MVLVMSRKRKATGHGTLAPKPAQRLRWHHGMVATPSAENRNPLVIRHDVEQDPRHELSTWLSQADRERITEIKFVLDIGLPMSLQANRKLVEAYERMMVGDGANWEHVLAFLVRFAHHHFEADILEQRRQTLRWYDVVGHTKRLWKKLTRKSQ